MSPLRIGFIGAGANTRDRHIPGFQAIEGVELAAVVNRSRASSQLVASRFGIPRVCEKVEDLLGDREIDAVCIGTWPYRHKEYSIAALEAGKHVLCEARMAMDTEQAEAMLAAAERNANLVAQLVPAPFDLRSGATVRRLIDEGAIGDVREVSVAALNGGGLDPKTPIHWRQQQKYSGRNIQSLGIWAEVIQRWLGDAKTVLAHGSIFVAERPNPEGGMTAVDVPDSVTVTGTLANGARYTYRVSSVAAAGPAENGITVFGTKGTIRWLPNDTATLTPHGSEARPIEPDPGTDLGWRVEHDFVDSIQNGTPVRFTSFPDGLRYMRFIDAAWRSVVEGCVVEV